MKINCFELGSISRYRGELMGAAIIFVMLFHVGLPRDDAFFGLRRMGNIGVDIFLFLSGIGLWFAWTKNPSIKDFLCRRFKRIYPTWFVIASLYYIPDYFFPQIVDHSGACTGIGNLIANIGLNINFWLRTELTFWYVPAIMALYVAAPFYMRLLSRNPVYRWLPVAMMAWCIVVQYVVPLNHALGHLEIFWSRLPIFFIGINLGQAVKENRQLAGSSVWLILFLFAGTLAVGIYLEQARHGTFPLFLERMLYIPLTVTAALLAGKILPRSPRWFNWALRFVGALSLEIYLLHYHFVMRYIERLHAGYWPTFLITLAATLPVAWLLGKAINKIFK